MCVSPKRQNVSFVRMTHNPKVADGWSSTVFVYYFADSWSKNERSAVADRGALKGGTALTRLPGMSHLECFTRFGTAKVRRLPGLSRLWRYLFFVLCRAADHSSFPSEPASRPKPAAFSVDWECKSTPLSIPCQGPVKKVINKVRVGSLATSCQLFSARHFFKLFSAGDSSCLLKPVKSGPGAIQHQREQPGPLFSLCLNLPHFG